MELRGLAAAEMAWLFGHPGGTAFAWQDLKQRGPITIALAGATAHDPDDVPTLTTELSDGRVHTRSGYPAVLEIDASHDSPGERFARSLNLALSQQWARAGLMMVHAAGVVVEGAGILVLGPKASGKSTLTAAILAAGGQAVSDDWMLMGMTEEGRPTMERLRGFLMLRRSWASDRLLQTGSSLHYHATRLRPKYTLPVDDRDPRFPVSHPVDRLCVLKRGGARPERSTQVPILPRNAMTALMAASMPLLFSAGFPEERRRLGDMAAGLLAKAGLSAVTCGTDIPTDVQRATRLWVTERPRSCNHIDAEGE